MNLILKRLQELADAELYALCEVVDQELERRREIINDLSDSARRRYIERGRSYRRCNGSAAPPVRIIGNLRPPQRDVA